ncbi:HlyD family secretion protein [Moorella sulfitireducens]|uniref:HlyD family secretion protein n=1 Tax=Neomoorella sulfitireducens TaxID=2972948 RepID=UPI0021AC4A04|nr:efflux RND transporter periplasmic adaptor subunit [Moorella sulfitireducens]
MGKGERTGLGLLAILLLILVLITGCQPREKEKLLKASGTIEATEIKVTAEVGGTLQDLTVKEGDTIPAGKIIGHLDQAAYQIQVDQAAAAVAAARAALAEARAGARSQEIAAAEQEVARLDAQVAAVQEQVTLLEDNLRRARELFQAGALPEQELVNLESQYNQGQHQLAAARAQLEAAKSRLALLQAGSTPYTLDRLAAGVQQSEKNLALAQLNLNKTTLRSPAAGLVASVNFEKGELVPQGAEVVTILDLNNLWLNVYIPENRLGEVQVGQPVQITVDTFPGHSFPGRVEYIAPQAEFTPRQVQTTEDRVNLVFRVKILVTGGQDKLRPGLPADVTFPAPV